MTMLIDAALRTSVVLSAGLLLRATLGHRSASLRHRVVTAALLATAAVVPLSLLVPAWTIPLGTAHGRSHSQPAVASGDRTAATMSAAGGAPPARGTDLPLGIIVWVLAAGANGGVLLFGIARLARVTARAQPLEDARWTRLAEQTCAEYGITRRIRILETGTPDVLATWGVVRPCVLLPRQAREWDEERARIVLRHELAHIRRHDWTVQIAAEVLRAVYCFNPLMWIACRRLRQDGEHACDDRVIDAGTSPGMYATHLLEIARICRRPAPVWAAAMLMARPSTLERRIAAMLNSNLDRRSATRGAMAVIAVLFLAVTLPASALRAAQTTPLPLKGSVYDASGAVLPDAELTLEGANNTAVKTRTDATGRFEFAPVEPGRYVLVASVAGFNTLRYPLELRSARDWDRAITLQVGELQETIMVRAQRIADAGTRGSSAAQQPVRVGGNIRAPLKVRDVRPIYPPSMRAAGREGVVPIEAIIGRDGSVSLARVLSAQVHPDFAAAALDAVRQWRFDPTLLNGEPVEVMMTVSVTFKLAD